MGIVWKQTMRYLDLRKNKPTNTKTNQQQKITFFTVAKSYKLFICEGHFTVD